MSTPRSQTPLTRLYITTAALTSPTSSTLTNSNLLPLISTLPLSTQASIERYHFHRDAQLSLGSALLKHYYVHRTTGIRWRDVHKGLTRKDDEKHGKPTWRGWVRVAERGNGTEVLKSIKPSAEGEMAEPDPAPPQQSHHQPQHQGQATPASPSQSADADHELEFNVSHQAGLVALIGVDQPLPISPSHSPSHPHPHPHPEHLKATPIPPALPSSAPTTTALPKTAQTSLGLDITAPTESSRPQSRISTQSDFEDWVDNFTDVFSAAEMREMKAGAPPGSLSDIEHPQDEAARIRAKLQKFYTHWALKEAYIKMTGEALLADWLRELEFRNVVVPPVSEEGAWGAIVWSGGDVRGAGEQGAGGGEKEEQGFEVLFRGSRVRGVRMGVRFLGSEWIIATCVGGEGGAGSGKDEEEEWNELTIPDIEPCAKGVCRCLD